MYTVCRKLENGDLIRIATRRSLEDAFQLIAAIKPLCKSAEYVVHDPEGKQALPFDQSDA
jgi:hypothetical protein